MFYAVNVLSSKGKLSAPWVAAYFDRRLSKQDIIQVNIEETVNSIESGEIPELALRTSSHILLGLSKILFRKTKILYDECRELFITVKRKSAEPQTKKTAKAEITYQIDLFKYVALPIYNTKDTDTSQSIAEIEIGRGSVDGLISNLEYSISLNNISIPQAESILENIDSTQTSIHKIEKKDDFIYQNISGISQGHISYIEDTFLGSPEKRKSSDHLYIKKHKEQKDDLTIEIENKFIQGIKCRLDKEMRMRIPDRLESIYRAIQEAIRSSTSVLDSHYGTLSLNSLRTDGPESLNQSFAKSFKQIEEDSIEVPRNTSIIDMPVENISYLGTLNSRPESSLDEILAHIKAEEKDIRKKTECFIRLLRHITEGTVRARQPVPYGPIEITA